MNSLTDCSMSSACTESSSISTCSFLIRGSPWVRLAVDQGEEITVLDVDAIESGLLITGS